MEPLFFYMLGWSLVYGLAASKVSKTSPYVDYVFAYVCISCTDESRNVADNTTSSLAKDLPMAKRYRWLLAMAIAL
jgi:hypothetical protein